MSISNKTNYIKKDDGKVHEALYNYNHYIQSL